MTDRELMQQALDALIRYEIDADGEWGECRSMCQIDADGDTPPIITALRERLAQPEQEPVAWITPHGEGFRIRFSPPTSGVPLGWDALYATPPEAQRKPLTGDQLEEIEMREKPLNGPKSMLNFARAIEAAHGIKENT